MSGDQSHPSREELSAYIDGELDDPRREAVIAHLSRSSEDAALVAAFRRRDLALRAGAVLLTGDRRAASLAAVVRAYGIRRRRQRLAAAAAVVLALLAGGAWPFRGFLVPPPVDMAEMASVAEAAYRIHAIERAGTAEPGDPASLAARLSERLGQEIRIPDLGRWGFRLVGDALLATDHGPVAQLTYEDASSRRITCLFKRRPVSADEDLRYREENGVVTAYGADADLGYAMTGRLPRHELLAIAEAVYSEADS
jgi:anti-sigma factor RsiW